MDRLLQMDRDEYVRQMREEVDRVLGQIADAVNAAPDGNVINGSEMQVRDLMGELRRAAYERAVQMRIDSTESSFFPSEGCVGSSQAEQGSLEPQRVDVERTDRHTTDSLARRGRGRRRST